MTKEEFIKFANIELTGSTIGNENNAYIKVTLIPLADGLYKILDYTELRPLASEVNRIYRKQPNHAYITPEDMIFVSGYGSMQRGFIVAEGWLLDLVSASNTLLSTEKQVAAYARSIITTYVGGSTESANQEE